MANCRSPAIASAVEKDRKVFGGKTPVPGVLIGVWDGQGGSYVHGFGYADLAKRRPMSAGDHFRITHEMGYRRINLALPAESLLMEKAEGFRDHQF